MTRRRTVLRHGLTLATLGIGVAGAINDDDGTTQTDDLSLDQCDLEQTPARPLNEEQSELPDAFRGETLGYYFASGMEPADAPLEPLTDVCFHALDIDEDGTPIVNSESEMAEIAEKALEVATTPHLQVGGMEVDFAPAVAHPEQFAAGAVDLMEEHGYRGLAIDWEYPEDGSEFALLMNTVRDALDERGDYHLGTAVSAVPSIADGVYAMDDVAPLLEYALIMSYDFAGPWSDRTGHNAALHSTDTAPLSVESALEYWRDSPLEDEQLLAGVPLYGYAYDGVSSENGGYDQPFDSGRGWTYADVTTFLESDHVEVYEDETAGVPYAYSADDGTFLSFETPDSVAAKTAFAREEVRGVGMWAVNQDPDAALLSAVAETE